MSNRELDPALRLFCVSPSTHLKNIHWWYHHDKVIGEKAAVSV